jgi:hypothetical protein
MLIQETIHLCTQLCFDLMEIPIKQQCLKGRYPILEIDLRFLFFLD